MLLIEDCEDFEDFEDFDVPTVLCILFLLKQSPNTKKLLKHCNRSLITTIITAIAI